MYNIYHLMRRRGAPSNRIWAVVNFMIHFYESDHLIGITAAIAAETCKPECAQREDHYMAYGLLLQKIPSEELKEKILAATPRQFFDLPDIPPHLRESLACPKPAPDLWKVGEDQEKAHAIHPSQVSPELARLIALGDELRGNREKIREAEQAFRDAIRIDRNNAKAWASLANFLHEETDRFEAAEASYRKAIELEPDVAWGWAHLGQLLHEKLDRFEEAESAYRKATELEPDIAWGWTQLGILLHEKLERYEEAQKAYLTSLERDDKDYFVWESLLKLQMIKLGDTNAAVNTMARYLQSAHRSPDSLINVACTIMEQWEDLYPQADAWMKEAIEKAPEVWPSYLALAFLQGSMGDWESALHNVSQYLRHTEVLPNAIGPLTDFFIKAAAAGYASEILLALKNSTWASHLEPLIAGLKIFLGEKPTIAQEILEVGQDVAKRIEARKRQISKYIEKPKT
jgi:tetratricopeptide (TPR) repeat protein